ncbi:MFS transporter [Paenibacillus lignilyticus]|uniref:MFS transporter n=1 Tax=Paenibacillus lignilyticus TaxID=1172615 RepID=A0ABS5CJL2_9BACL|nr:MFS transporter [Paenibacillus lignilyticus]MBP3966075.1 MFS transporter [Paenibacillus lignilyticus]
MPRVWRRIQGNARNCLLYEPLFLIPFNMYMTYASIYMLELGVSETQIGLITSIGMAMQILTSLISGHLTDKMGRRRALLVYDLISWSVATLIWAVSQNFWFFLAAAVVNSFQRVPTTAWYCLLVEDTDPEDRSIVFTILMFIGVIGGLFAPLGGLFVSQFTLVPAMRIMYVIAFIGMTIMMIVRHFTTHETAIGLKKMEESSKVSLSDTITEYKDVMKLIVANKALMIIFGVYILFNFQMTLRNTYLSVYWVDALHINDSIISIFPAISSAAMILFLMVATPRLKERLANQYMIAGFLISAVSFVMLLTTGPGNITATIISTVLMAIGGLLASPYLESSIQNAIDDHNRAKVFSILGVLILIFTFPAGILGGWTYTINAKFPLVFIVVAFLASVIMMFLYARRTSRADLHSSISG